jgi:hypothetical protein
VRGLCGGYTTGISPAVQLVTRVEEVSSTSTVTVRVVGGEEKGSLESGTVKYGHERHRTRTGERLRWRGPAAIVNDRPVLSSERAPHINKSATYVRLRLSSVQFSVRDSHGKFVEDL